jgi:Tfp pilus assembly protein PilO
MSELLDHIQTAARSINLTLNAMSSKKGQPLPEYPEIDFRIIDLSLTGEYTQAKHFLFKLEKLPYFLMKHHEMKITGKDRIVNINIKLRIPFLKNY